jgi:hypothetical protein
MDNNDKREVLVISKQTLAFVVDSIIETMKLQAGMVAGLSEHVKYLDDGDEKQEHINAIVTFNQIEDRVRQRHEDMIHALDAVIGTLDELAVGAAEASHESADSLTEKLLGSQVLGEMREKLYKAILPHSAKYTLEEDTTPSGEVDLF